jgi:hypothetical protein
MWEKSTSVTDWCEVIRNISTPVPTPREYRDTKERGRDLDRHGAEVWVEALTSQWVFKPVGIAEIVSRWCA